MLYTVPRRVDDETLQETETVIVVDFRGQQLLENSKNTRLKRIIPVPMCDHEKTQGDTGITRESRSRIQLICSADLFEYPVMTRELINT